MGFELTGFSQDVDLSKPKEVKYCLVFSGGLRLEVPKATVDVLIEKVYAGSNEQTESPPYPDYGQGEQSGETPPPDEGWEQGTVFGGNYTTEPPEPALSDEEQAAASQQREAYLASLEANPDPDLAEPPPPSIAPPKVEKKPAPAPRPRPVPPNPAKPPAPAPPPRRAPLRAAAVGDDGVASI